MPEQSRTCPLLEFLTQIALKGLPRPMLASDWVDAVNTGPQAVARWLTCSAQHTPPRLKTITDEQAEAVISFRAEVGKIDSKCSLDAETTRCRQMRVDLARNTQQLRDGFDGPWTCAARVADLLHRGDAHASSFYITKCSLRRLICKRPPSKASAQLP